MFNPFSKRSRTLWSARRQREHLIPDVREGQQVKLSGCLELVDEPLFSPLSGLRCAAWEVVTEVLWSTARGVSSWTAFTVQREAQPFFLLTTSGRALVECPPLLLDPAQGPTPVFSDDLTAEAQARATARLVGEEQLRDRSRSFRYFESLLAKGDALSVVGRARWEPDPTPREEDRASYREAPRRLVISAPPEGALVVLQQSMSQSQA